MKNGFITFGQILFWTNESHFKKGKIAEQCSIKESHLINKPSDLLTQIFYLFNMRIKVRLQLIHWSGIDGMEEIQNSSILPLNFEFRFHFLSISCFSGLIVALTS